MIVVPLFTEFRAARNVLGLMLPLLFSTDILSLVPYWKQWHRENVWRLVPGAIIGIILGRFILVDISDIHLKKVIGGIVCVFAILELFRPRLIQLLDPNRADAAEPIIRFKVWHGVLAGILTGIISTLAHMGGVVVLMYLIPQRLGTRTFVATTTALYFLINLVKIPFYFQLGLFSYEIFIETLALLPWLGIGVLMGVWLNNRFPERLFSRIMLFFLFGTGLHLLFG